MGSPGPGQNTQAQAVTRLAPSPTGALHPGNARTFLVNWALARQRGWRVILRIEDLDTPRVKPGAVDETIDTLRWLGLDWDDEAPLQTADLTPYRDAMSTLANLGVVYPCELSRAQIEAAASAPNEGDHEQRFPPELRPASFRQGKPTGFDRAEVNWRLAVEPGLVAFDDAFAGPQSRDVARTVGDFVLWTKRGQPSYQLAVVVDDARRGITEVVRGDDLLGSAARQILLYRLLGLGPTPRYTHLPLVRGPDGRRLAKRHGDTRLTHYRALGVPAERIIGLIASWSGVAGPARAMSARGFTEAFDISTMPRHDITFTEAHERWLIRGTPPEHDT
ncbi:MAG: tRNA glutamyl-Q(34) synthetase GluQRS [Phycisphaeraceae bacterium]|nr:MAG: tRNA glutamyl-Q(34) synthetase GluQRS [Phycisphaeraceae bacterium]